MTCPLSSEIGACDREANNRGGNRDHSRDYRGPDPSRIEQTPQRTEASGEQ